MKTKPTKKATKMVVTGSLSESDVSDDEENEGVDEEGMARLMKALGDDGLDEFGQAQLQSLAGDDDDSPADKEGEDEDDAESDEESSLEIDEEDRGEKGEGSESENEGSEDGDGDEGEEEDEGADVEVLLDDVETVDEDAVPRQKIEVDDKVYIFVQLQGHSTDIHFLGRPRTNT